MTLEEIASRLETYLFWGLAEFGVFAKVECITHNSTFWECRIDVVLADFRNLCDKLQFPVRVDAFALWSPAASADPLKAIRHLADHIATDKAKWFLA